MSIYLWDTTLDGLVSGQLVYHVESGQIEQDVALLNRLPDPAKLGLNPATTFVQALTRFVEAPNPAIRREQVALNRDQSNLSFEDHHLSFGSFHLAMGRAFAVAPTIEPGQARASGTLVYKRWEVSEGVPLLIESVPYSAYHQLEQAAGLPERYQPGTNALGEPSAVVIDWTAVQSQSWYIFSSGQTYRITGDVTFTSAVSFEANAVLKYDRNARLWLQGAPSPPFSVSCPASGTAILTAVDDWSAGEQIGDNALTGTYASQALYIYPYAPNSTIRNLQIRYAYEGIMAYSSGLNLQNITFLNCTRGVSAYWTSVYADTMTFCDTSTQFYNQGSSSWYPYGTITSLVGSEDPDADGLTNSQELGLGTNPNSSDTNANGITDADEDFEGDGLPNLAEFRLMKSPRRADNPLNLNQLSSGTVLSGQNFIEIPVSVHLGRMPISLLVDGVGSPDAVLDKNGAGKWGIFLETRHSVNGARTLQLDFQYRSLPTFYGQATRVTGTQKNPQFNNQAIFNPSAARFERRLVVDAILPSIPTASYEVEVYNDQGALLDTEAGQTTDGTVFALWDTVDAQGNPTVNGNLAAYFHIVPPSGPPIYIGPKWYIQERAALDGRYIIAWGWDTGGNTFHAQHKENMMLDGVINIVGNPGLDNEYLLSPAANIPFGGAFRVQSATDKTTLQTEFQSSANKNFFFFGHGSDLHISPFKGENPPVTILADDIENWLQNKAHRAMGREHLSSIYKNHNPYRLAIINSCESYSEAFANAFGVDFETSSTFVYNVLGRTPRAYVSWTSQIAVPGVLFRGIDFYDHAQYAEALAVMNSYWMSGADLHTCLIQFADKAQDNGFGTEPWDFEIAGCNDLVRLP